MNLLKELNISRATAYRRARKYDISLANLSSGLSDDEIEKLKLSVNTEFVQSNNHVKQFLFGIHSNLLNSLKTQLDHCSYQSSGVLTS